MSVEGFLASLLAAVRTLDARARDVPVGFTPLGAALGTFEILAGGGAAFAAADAFGLIDVLARIGALAGVLFGVLLATFIGVRAEALAGVCTPVLLVVFAFADVKAVESAKLFGDFSSSE